MQDRSLFPAVAFSNRLKSWCENVSGFVGRMAAAAALKDMLALLETAPVAVSQLLPGESPFNRILHLSVSGTICYIRSSLLAVFRRYAERSIVGEGKRSRLVKIQSPLSNGIPVDHVAKLEAENGGRCSLSSIGLGSLNPGRCGLSTLGGEQVLWWRWWEIAEAATERDLRIIVLPSPRIPAGTRLPEGYPFIFEGIQNGDWASVGVLIAPEFLASIQFSNEYCTTRVIWLRILQPPPLRPWAIAAIYGPTGGDLPFWQKLLSDRMVIMKEFRIHRTVVIGDGNIHLCQVVSHPDGCQCLHCKQRLVDQDIAKLLAANGLSCVNPVNSPTHVSGTTPDIVLSEIGGGLGTVHVLHPGKIARSDHSLIHTDLSLSVDCSYSSGFGRVSWVSDSQWEVILKDIDPNLQLLSQVAESVSADEGLLVATACQSQQGKRRKIIDTIVWLREAWFSIIGHLGGAVQVRLPKSSHPIEGLFARLKSRANDADSSDSDDGHIQHDWARSQRRIGKYLTLKSHDSGAADKFLSALLKPNDCISLELVDPFTHCALDWIQSLEVVKQDLINRTLDATPADPVARSACERYVSSIRRSGAISSSQPSPTPQKYTMTELQGVLRALKTRSRCLRGCHAASRVRLQGARLLILAIINLCVAFQTAPTTTFLRLFFLLKKKGPNTVRDQSNIRPVSLVSDLMAVHDGLFLSRHRKQLSDYWGPSQCGGSTEALACVVAAVLLCQVRKAIGLQTFLPFEDVKSAFDGASRVEMLAGLFDAGVTGSQWMLVDDQLRNDTCAIPYGQAVTGTFKLDEGTAQGRKISVDLFNCVMKKLRDYICRASSGVGAWSSDWPNLVLSLAAIISPPSEFGYDAKSARILGRKAASAVPNDIEATATLLAESPSQATRMAAVDMMADQVVQALLYIDDVLAPAASGPQVAEIWKGCEQFTNEVGPRFNLGRTKSAVMGPMGAGTSNLDAARPLYFGHEVPVVDLYPYLGFMLDVGLTFAKHFSSLIARGWAAFKEFLGASSSLGLPTPLQALEVPRRVEPAALYGLELCISVPGAEAALDHMQAGWAKHLLGIGNGRQGLHAFLLAECGWCRRLSTSMLLRAVMLKARIQLLPPHHLAASLLVLADSAGYNTWSEAVDRIRRDSRLPYVIPLINVAHSEETLVELRNNKDARRKALEAYRCKLVIPALCVLDERAFADAAARCKWPYTSFQHGLCEYPQDLLRVNWGPDTWYFYRAWAIVRVTGRLPLQVFGGDGIPLECTPCELCGAASVDIAHLLGECAATFNLYLEWWSGSGHRGLPAGRLDWPSLQMELFADRVSFVTASTEEGACRIRYVGAACKKLAVAQRDKQLDGCIENLLSGAAALSSAEMCPGEGP